MLACRQFRYRIWLVVHKSEREATVQISPFTATQAGQDPVLTAKNFYQRLENCELPHGFRL